MVLHLGCDEYVPLSSIVAVLDAERSPGLLRDVMQSGENEPCLQRIGSEKVRSIVVACVAGRRVFFLSPISAGTLCRRTRERSLI